MQSKYGQAVVTTIPDRCRVCYTCVRECPAKAIRIANGQAEVIPERCIGCGNCVRVCSQKAKKVVSSIKEVKDLLASGRKVSACIAPSFPAEFGELDYKQFVSMVRSLGFTYVHEVAFGADLIARNVRQLLAELKDKKLISTPCPAVFGYVKRYHPELIECLAPVVSPMVATARALRVLYGEALSVVFIGPCIAKKLEAYSDELHNEIDEVLTFEELHYMFEESSLNGGNPIDAIRPTDFDPPRSYKGGLFPIGRGLLEAADIHEDLVAGEVISASGKTNFIGAIMEFSQSDTNAKLLDILCCDGCIMGSGMTTTATPFRRRALVSNFVRQTMSERDVHEWYDFMEKLSSIDLSRTFKSQDQRIPVPAALEIRKILGRMGKNRSEDELNCGACGYDTCHEHAIAIHKGLAESEMCLPFMIEKLHKTIDELGISNEQLANTREALIQSEKMASMGQLAAGIAHEINNPLGVVLMYAHLLMDESGDSPQLKDDLKMIADHADRAKKIVAGLLNFARQNKVNLKPVNIPELIADSVRSIQVPENITVKTYFNMKNSMAELDRDQIIQVFTNFCNNSITAMPDGGCLTIDVEDEDDRIKIKVTDTGCGIPKEIISKIFEPFFTTRKSGKGTGLGLAITYGILKMHRGDIQVESNADPTQGATGTTLTVTLPRAGMKTSNPI